MKVLGKSKITLKKRARIVAVSGGADSVYLVKCFLRGSPGLLVAHFNHEARGKESEKDQKFVEELSGALGIPIMVGKRRTHTGSASVPKEDSGTDWAGFERKARQERHNFLQGLKKGYGAEKILMGHTADDQVETILMRFLEGAGITGLKGIPTSTENGIERPLLQTWREDILKVLRKNKFSFRVDRSNFDIRFERNWIRHVLIPLLEKRYGKSVKKRIFLMGERFREMDVFIQQTAYKWVNKNLMKTFRFSRKSYTALPSVVRMKILQILCFERIGTSPNERLLGSMDRLIVSGSPSARVSIGKGATLRCQYGEAILSSPGEKGTSGEGGGRFVRPGKGKEHKGRRVVEEGAKTGKKKRATEPVFKMEGPGIYRWNQPARGGGGVEAGSPGFFIWEERGKAAPGRIRKMAGGERQAIFDAELLSLPLSVRPLKAGDRVRPFGLEADKKVKEILIDRKIPRDERWGRPVVCDYRGEILWIPGVIRSSHAPVTPKTRRTIVLRTEFAKGGKP